MRPPECRVCDKKMGKDDGGLVQFEKRPSDIEWDKKANKIEGFVGHPPYIDWFCSKHYNKAKELKSLTIDKVMKILKS